MFFIFTLHFYFFLTCCICEIQYSDLWVDVHSMKTLRVIKEGLNISNWAPVQNALPLRETCAIKTSLNLQPSISLAQQGQKLKVKNNSCSPERHERKQGEEKAKALTGQRKEGEEDNDKQRGRNDERGEAARGKGSRARWRWTQRSVQWGGEEVWIIWLSYFFLSILFLDFHFLPIIQPLRMFSCWCHQTQTQNTANPRWTHSVPACTAVRLRLKRQQHDAYTYRTTTASQVHTHRHNTTGVSTFISMNKVWLQPAQRQQSFMFLLICTPQVWSIEFTDRAVCQWAQQVQLQLITNVSRKQDNGH